MKDPTVLENWQQLANDDQFERVLKKLKKQHEHSNILDYQVGYLNQALSFVKKFDVAIDAGAHYGLMSFHLDKKFSNVHSFEINENVRNCLKINVENFNLKNVKIYDCGLGEAERLVSLNHSRGTFGTYIDPEFSNGSVLIKTIDQLNLHTLDFIKIDCEGYEPFILKGGEQTIKKFNPVILMERKGHTERWGLNKFEPVNILKGWGYDEIVSYEKDCIMVKQNGNT